MKPVGHLIPPFAAIREQMPNKALQLTPSRDRADFVPNVRIVATLLVEFARVIGVS